MSANRISELRSQAPLWSNVNQFQAPLLHTPIQTRFTGTESSHNPFDATLSKDTLTLQYPLRQPVRFSGSEGNSWLGEFWEEVKQGWQDNRVHRFQTSSFLLNKLWEGLGNITESVRFHFFSPKLASLQGDVAGLIVNTPIGFPKAFARAQLFRDNDPTAFDDYAAIRKAFSRKTVPPAKLAEQFIRSESDAYMATHLLALEQALSNPKQMINPNSSRNRSLRFAIDDANGIVTRRVKQLYGQDTRLVHKDLYDLIFDTPKVNLHEHARGSFPIPGLRAALIADKHPRAYDDYEDLQNYYRAQRPFTEDGKIQLFMPTLNRYRTKYDLMVRAAKSRWQYYLGTYMYSLRAGLENVRYFEYRYYPFSPKDPLPGEPKPDPMTLAENNARAVQLGLDDAKGFLAEYHKKKLDANMIFSAYRATALASNGDSLDYARKHPEEARRQRVEDATKVLDAAIHCRKKGLRVTGFDICGDEENFAITDFASVGQKLREYNRDAYTRLQTKQTTQDMRIGASIHAGEVYDSGKVSHPNRPLSGDESVQKTIELFWEGILVTTPDNGPRRAELIDGKQAYELFKAQKLLNPGPNERQELITVSPVRIGHGVRAAQNPTLLEFCKLLQIGFEQCPKSNRQTGIISRYEDFPAVRMSRYGIPVSISRDNSTVSKTNSTNELIKATRYNGATHVDRKRFQEDGLKTAFIFDNSKEDSIIRHMEDLFETIEERHNSVILKELDAEQRDKLLNWDVTPEHFLFTNGNNAHY